jgi:nitrite reductase/ring-hydroxylating ferredoxin subunit
MSEKQPSIVAPCEHDCPLLDRRTFLSNSVLAAAALALAACGVSSATAPSSLNTTVKLNDYPALATVGGVAVATLSGTRVALVRTSTSTVAVLSLICPHQGGQVNQSGSGFLCSVHGAQFTANGTWTGGERTSSLKSYATSYDASTGVVTIS